MYSDAYLMDGIGYWSQPIAVLVCAMEILVGLLALRTRYMKICCIVMLLMLSFFVWLTGINYFSPSIMGSIESCGCFGELIHFTPLASFIKSVVLLGVCCLFGCVLQNVRITRQAARNRYLMLSSILGLALPLYSAAAFGQISNTIYTSIYIIICFLSFVLLCASRIVDKNSNNSSAQKSVSI